VYLVTSIDGGSTWGVLTEVDKPGEGEVGAGPKRIQVKASGDNVFLYWEADHTDIGCTQYYQISPDGGNTWQLPQRKPQDFLGCPAESQIFEGDGDDIPADRSD
jgi:hypothetical protein